MKKLVLILLAGLCFTGIARSQTNDEAKAVAGSYFNKMEMFASTNSQVKELGNVEITANADNTVDIVIKNFFFDSKSNEVVIKSIPVSVNGSHATLNGTSENSNTGIIGTEFGQNFTFDGSVENGELTGTLSFSLLNILPSSIVLSPTAYRWTTTNNVVTFTAGDLTDDDTQMVSSLGLTGVNALDVRKIDGNLNSFTFAQYHPNVLVYTKAEVSGDNVVAGGVCSKLVLDDTYSIYVPETFRATIVDYNRAFSSDNTYTTVCLPFSFNVPADVTVAQFQSAKDGTLSFAPVAKTEAYKGYLFFTSNEKPFSEVSDVEVVARPATMPSTTYSGITLTGAVAVDTLNATNYPFSESEAIFYRDLTGPVAAYRAYLTTETTAASSAFSVSVGQKTGISALNAASATEKMFSVDGRRISAAPQQGVYIKGGKKVIVP